MMHLQTTDLSKIITCMTPCLKFPYLLPQIPLDNGAEFFPEAHILMECAMNFHIEKLLRFEQPALVLESSSCEQNNPPDLFPKILICTVEIEGKLISYLHLLMRGYPRQK